MFSNSSKHYKMKTMKKISDLLCSLNWKRKKIKKGQTLRNSSLLSQIAYERELTNNMPSFIFLKINQVQTYELQWANLMLNTAFEKKEDLVSSVRNSFNPQMVKDIKMDQDIEKVLKNCLDYIEVPQHMLELANLMDKKGSPDLGFVAIRKAFEKLKEIRKKNW